MKEIGFDNLINEKLVMALGYFDCVHLGHRMLIDAAKKEAKQSGAKSAVFTFNNNAYKVFNPDDRQIYTYEERKTVLAALGVDYVFSCRFDKFFRETDKTDFLREITKKLNIVGFVCGYDYLFGKGAEGNAEYLAAFCRENGLKCEIIGKFELDGERVSSTAVKNYLRHGKVKKAAEFLGEPYFIRDRVIHGRGEGRLFGYPTANIRLSHTKFLPQNGVYATTTEVDGKVYNSTTNVGSKPTFNDGTISVETFLDGFEGDLYDQTIKVSFLERIRDVKKFDSPEKLKERILADLDFGRKLKC